MRVNRSEATAISRDELTQNPQSSQTPIRSRNPVSATAIDKRMLVYCCVRRKGFMRVNRSEATAISRDKLAQNQQSLHSYLLAEKI